MVTMIEFQHMMIVVTTMNPEFLIVAAEDTDKEVEDSAEAEEVTEVEVAEVVEDQGFD